MIESSEDKQNKERMRRARLPKESPLKLQRKVKELEPENEALKSQIGEKDEEIGELTKNNVELYKLATRDGLTGLLTRGPFNVAVRQNVKLLQYSQKFDRVALFLIDVDDFKWFNTNHGHPGGDAVLVSIARILTEDVFRRDGVDFVSRYGGDEILACCLVAGDTEAAEMAEVVRRGIAERAAKQAGMPEGVTVTVSIGIVAIRDNVDVEVLHDQLSSALKKSKSAGKNRFVDLGLLRGENDASADV